MITEYVIKCDYPDCENQERVRDFFHLFIEYGWVSNKQNTKHLCTEHRVFSWEQVEDKRKYQLDLVKKAGHESS